MSDPENKDSVHGRKARRPKRIARGIRMPAAIWAGIDDIAEANGMNGGRLAERWLTQRLHRVQMGEEAA